MQGMTDVQSGNAVDGIDVGIFDLKPLLEHEFGRSSPNYQKYVKYRPLQIKHFPLQRNNGSMY